MIIYKNTIRWKRPIMTIFVTNRISFDNFWNFSLCVLYLGRYVSNSCLIKLSVLFLKVIIRMHNNMLFNRSKFKILTLTLSCCRFRVSSRISTFSTSKSVTLITSFLSIIFWITITQFRILLEFQLLRQIIPFKID